MPHAHDTHRQALLKKRSQILAALRMDRGQSNDRVAEEDQGSVAHEEFVNMRLNHLDYSQLRLIDEALERINSGDYGLCMGCEEDIPGKRLLALPWAKYCVPCQEHVQLERVFENRPYRLAS